MGQVNQGHRPAAHLRLGRNIVNAIEQHARQAAPAECCGLLGGKGNVVLSIYPLRNTAEMPETRYFAELMDVFAAFKEMRGRGEQLLGIYHSHPHSAAHPSEIDIRQAYYPEAVYFIMSLEPHVELRAYRIISGQVEEVAYEMSEDDGIPLSLA